MYLYIVLRAESFENSHKLCHMFPHKCGESYMNRKHELQLIVLRILLVADANFVAENWRLIRYIFSAIVYFRNERWDTV